MMSVTYINSSIVSAMYSLYYADTDDDNDVNDNIYIRLILVIILTIITIKPILMSTGYNC